MARRRKNSSGSACIYVPQINMEPSEMYVGLLNKEVSRPLTNYIYAKYLTSDAADKMDALGYKRNDQGQHSAKDVYEYFKVGSMVNEQGYSLNKLENKYNVTDSSGERRLLSSREAYRIARGRTAVNRSYVEGATLAWQALENGFRNLGLSLDTLENTVPDLVNPGRVINFLDYVGRLSRADVDSLNERDILILLNTGNNGPLVQNLLNRGWGTLQETAAKAYDVLVNPSNYASDTVNFVKNALTQAKTINSNVFRNLRNEIKDNVLTPFYENAEDTKINAKLGALNEKYGINHTVIKIEDDSLKRLSDIFGFSIEMLPFDGRTQELDKEVMRNKFIVKHPDIVVVNHVSNVTGKLLPVDEIFNASREYGAVNILDASQSLGLVPIDLSSQKTDFLIFAGQVGAANVIISESFACATGGGRYG